MRIVADRAIPFIRPLFAGLGRLDLVDGRRLDRGMLGDADVLVVRTVTRVDRDLLAGSGVRFVATATSGCDHVDRDWLAAAGIGFADAGGCNARAVAEYVLSSLCVLSQMRGLDLERARVGIVGAGHVGSRLAELLGALDIPCLLNDPPLAERTGDAAYRPLGELLDLEVLSFHVPLTDTGDHPTRGMLNSGLLGRLRPDVTIINAARGAICDEDALVRFIEAHPEAAAVIDVWVDEPAVNPALLQRAVLGTAHIAGYSLDAKLRAARMVSEAAYRHFGMDTEPAPEPALPDPPGRDIHLSSWDTELEAVQMAILASYDVRGEAAQLRRLPALDPAERERYFVDLRTNYPYRREFPAYRVTADNATASLRRRLGAVGFEVANIA